MKHTHIKKTNPGPWSPLIKQPPFSGNCFPRIDNVFDTNDDQLWTGFKKLGLRRQLFSPQSVQDSGWSNLGRESNGSSEAKFRRTTLGDQSQSALFGQIISHAPEATQHACETLFSGLSKNSSAKVSSVSCRNHKKSCGVKTINCPYLIDFTWWSLPFWRPMAKQRTLMWNFVLDVSKC